MTNIQARNLDDAMDTIELALSDYRARNNDYRNAKISKERIDHHGGFTHRFIAPNGSRADMLITKINRENFRFFGSNQWAELFNEEFKMSGAGRVGLRNDRFFGCRHWLDVYATNLTLLESFAKKSGRALEQKYEQQRAPYRGETFEINYYICDERHPDAVNLKNSINYELARF